MNKGEKMKSPTKDDIREQKVTWKNKCNQAIDDLKVANEIIEELKLNIRGVIALYKEEKGIPLSDYESSKFEHYRLSQADSCLSKLKG